jgi:ankyrin repeat protein
VQQTPLIRAADNGKTDVVVRLLSARVNPNANDEHRIGNTAILEAVRGGHTDIVSLLLRAGADPTITGWMGISAVDQAWDEIESDNATIKAIRALLRSFPSSLRDKIQEQNKALYPNTDPPRD